VGKLEVISAKSSRDILTWSRVSEYIRPSWTTPINGYTVYEGQVLPGLVKQIYFHVRIAKFFFFERIALHLIIDRSHSHCKFAISHFCTAIFWWILWDQEETTLLWTLEHSSFSSRQTTKRTLTRCERVQRPWYIRAWCTRYHTSTAGPQSRVPRTPNITRYCTHNMIVGGLRGTVMCRSNGTPWLRCVQESGRRRTRWEIMILGYLQSLRLASSNSEPVCTWIWRLCGRSWRASWNVNIARSQ
jgi:hypothetical protein